MSDLCRCGGKGEQQAVIVVTAGTLAMPDLGSVIGS